MGRFRDVIDVAMGRRAIGMDSLRDRRPITVASIGGQQSLTLDLDAEARGYSNSAVAYRCVAAIADNGSGVPLAVQRPDGSQIDGHRIAHLFNKKPNPLMSARVFKSLMLQQGELAGQSFIWLDRGETGLGDPEEAHIVFDQVDIVVDKPVHLRPTMANLVGFMIRRADGTQVPVLPEEMLWLRYPHPFDPLGCLAPWKAARHAVDMDAYAREWQRSSYKNGASPSGVVYLGQMEENAFAAAKASWRSSMQGPENAGKNLLVASPPGGGTPVSYARVGLTAEEMDYLESRMANADEVMMAFGVRRDVLTGGSTYENQQAAVASLWSQTIKPKLELIGSEIDRVLLPSDAEDAEFDLSGVEALQEAQDAVAQRIRALVYADVPTIDEARAANGWEPLPNGQGDMTLTPYRAQFAPVQGAAGTDDARSWDADFSRLLPVAPDVGPVVERAVEAALARLLGPAPVAPQRAELTRADDGPSSPSLAEVNAAYDELEATGVRAVRALAREQQARVLRDFDRLMKKPQRSSDWLAEVRAEACALAREQQLTLAPPDLDVVPAARATDMDVATGPAGWEERIKVRDIFDGGYWRRATAAALRPFVERAWRRGGATITGSFDLDEPDVATALTDRIDELAGQVTATTEQVLRSQLLAHGVAEGESVPELRARLQKVFANLSDFRATMIARTETVGGYSQASFLAALDAGAVRKTWVSTDDKRTRRTHRAAQGSSVAMNKRFPLTESRWPADPAAPANQSIQCFPADTAVQFGELHRAFRRWYEGDLVELATAQGKKLSGTPNHPVLTERGWVPLGELQEGDELVAYRAEPDGARGHDVDAGPAAIGEVFDALDVAGKRVRVRGSGVDFHGDGLDGDVDVVAADGLLRGGNVAAPGELSSDLTLPSADTVRVGAALGSERAAGHLGLAAGTAENGSVGGLRESGSLLGGGAGHARDHGVTAPTDGSTGSLQQPANGPAADAELLGQGLLGVAREVPADNVIRVVRRPSAAGNNLRASQLMNAPALEEVTEGDAGDADLGSEVLLGLSGLVATDQVVSVRRVPGWSGHVYNLQTGSGTYAANGIVVHNCRCALTFEFEEN